VFHVGDEVDTPDSGIHLVIREVATHHGRTRYRVEAASSSPAAANGTWWVYADEVQPARRR
jgi:hypothetical protein